MFVYRQQGLILVPKNVGAIKMARECVSHVFLLVQ